MSTLYEWSPARRRGWHACWGWAAWAAAACTLSGLGAYAGHEAAARAAQAGRFAFERAQAREARARALLAEHVPVNPVRPAVARAGMNPAPVPDPLANLVLRVAAQLETSGLRLNAFSPVQAMQLASPPSPGASAPPAHSYKLSAIGDVASVRRWLNGLSTLPALAVPVSFDLKRAGSGVALEAHLQLYPELRADFPNPGQPHAASGIADISDGAAAREIEHAFDEINWDAAPVVASAWQLAGWVRDARGALAVFERGGESLVLAPGQALDGARVQRIGTSEVSLAQEGVPGQRIQLREAREP